MACSEKEPLLQMVLLSALNGRFLSSLVVMMAPTFSLCSLSYSLTPFLSFLSFSLLQPTLRALKDTCLLISFQQLRKEDDFSLLFCPLMHILGTFKKGPSEFSKAVLYSAWPAYGRDECRSVLLHENV